MPGKYGDMKRQVPKMTTDEEAEAFLDSDLSDLDFVQFKPARFSFVRGLQRRFRREFVLAPGTPAPKSGLYQQTGPRGGRPGKTVTGVAGKPLPSAPAGRKWTLVSPNGHGRH